jgi:voltage-gated potassium channel
VNMRARQRMQRRFVRQGLTYSLVVAVVIMGLGGVGFWLVEPKAHTLADGLWLAFTTAATVGYGDIVPSTHTSRGFAVVMVLLGLAVLSMVTASVAALFVQTEERKIEHELLHEIRQVRDEVTALRQEVEALRRDNPKDLQETP